MLIKKKKTCLVQSRELVRHLTHFQGQADIKVAQDWNVYETIRKELKVKTMGGAY